MYRSHNCGELRAKHIGNEVRLSGWVQKIRDKGFMVWVDLRYRYGIAQLIFDEERSSKELLGQAQKLGMRPLLCCPLHIRACCRPNANEGSKSSPATWLRNEEVCGEAHLWCERAVVAGSRGEGGEQCPLRL